MDNYKTLLDILKIARIHAGAEFERLCNNKQPVDAFVFQSIRDCTASAIRLLENYIKSNEKVRTKNIER